VSAHTAHNRHYVRVVTPWSAAHHCRCVRVLLSRRVACRPRGRLGGFHLCDGCMVRTVRSENVDEFTAFASSAAPRLANALISLLGVEAGHDATWEALAHGWENWEKVSGMGNPVGYLYVIGRNSRRGLRKQRVVFPEPPVDRTPWVEPGLSSVLEGLPTRQRQAVMLVHGYGWTWSEVAEVLDVSKTTVQKHVERGVAKLRAELGVSL